MLSRGVLVLMSAVLGVACTAGGGQDAGPGRDGGSDAAPTQPDAGPQRCDTNAECDDGFGCTIDECIVGNVCRHDPIDGRCDAAAGERCVVGRGCTAGTPTDCETHADCDDGNVCNGTEQCIVGGCFMGTALNCGDGNACTADTCDATDGCRHQLICDGGTMPDAGPPCDDFDPAAHYTGTFRMLPPQSCSAGLDMYSVNTLVFSVSGATLTVSVRSTAGERFSLTQSPVPTGPSFDVSGSDGCASVRLTGTFSCSDLFMGGTWTANHQGNCAFCGTTSSSVSGVRR